MYPPPTITSQNVDVSLTKRQQTTPNIIILPLLYVIYFWYISSDTIMIVLPCILATYLSLHIDFASKLGALLTFRVQY